MANPKLAGDVERHQREGGGRAADSHSLISPSLSLFLAASYSLSLSFYMYFFIYIYVYISRYIHMYVYIYMTNPKLTGDV